MGDDHVAVRVNITGRVQGVFFRGSTFDAAVSRKLAGYVKNMRNGSVEAVFQGPESQVDAVVAWCWKGSPASRVDQVTVSAIDVDPNRLDFQVKF